MADRRQGLKADHIRNLDIEGFDADPARSRTLPEHYYYDSGIYQLTQWALYDCLS
ncbi:MAG: hypothetical protein GY935_13110 [Gammaproteobacteria bacterium]|nr:hypothetical protein [Gammaproteobacteria bacterium]